MTPSRIVAQYLAANYVDSQCVMFSLPAAADSVAINKLPSDASRHEYKSRMIFPVSPSSGSPPSITSQLSQHPRAHHRPGGASSGVREYDGRAWEGGLRQCALLLVRRLTIPPLIIGSHSQCLGHTRPRRGRCATWSSLPFMHPLTVYSVYRSNSTRIAEHQKASTRVRDL
jgi:hypothetical protein